MMTDVNSILFNKKAKHRITHIRRYFNDGPVPRQYSGKYIVGATLNCACGCVLVFNPKYSSNELATAVMSYQCPQVVPITESKCSRNFDLEELAKLIRENSDSYFEPYPSPFAIGFMSDGTLVKISAGSERCDLTTGDFNEDHFEDIDCSSVETVMDGLCNNGIKCWINYPQ
jgi:hypothetical protein